MKLAEITSSLSSLNKDYASTLINNEIDSTSGQLLDNGSDNKSSFSSMLKKSINEVNNTQVTAYNAMNDIATGKVENLQEAVQKIQEAELSLKLGLEIKNKALGAYKQIMAMQI